MASTDAKSGFRLPWSTDRNESDDQAPTDATADTAQTQSADEPATADTTAAVADTTETAPESPVPEPLAEVAPVDVQADAAVSEPVASVEPPTPAAPEAPAARPASRKSNKFMADLTKAMQTAAEAARADVLEKFSAEAKAHIEGIHATTADEATALRKRADDDIAAIRDWSKAEIARIREETDERIAHRKDVLEREIEAHAAEIESRIEHVQTRVTSFEGEMAAFFERLLAEEDPTRFAAMAETLPEPPAFDDDAPSSDWSVAAEVPVAEAPLVEAAAPVELEANAPVEPAPEPVAEATAEAAPEPVSEPSGWESSTPAETPVAEETPVADATPAPEPVQEDAGDLFSIPTDEPTEADPRLSALGIQQDFAAAEAEAADYPTDGEGLTDEQAIPTIAEDALAARLAGLVAEEPAPAGEAATTRVIVTGLVSVASIAGFKRNLARVNGVRSVGVSSGPDGEFVFAVAHDPGLDLTDGIATLPGFGARVTNEAAGELTVAARDPESEG